MVSLPHPIQYQGSKRKLASEILKFLPKKIDRLVEPFAGTAAISLAAAAREICQSFWINDLNKPLIELLELIVENPDNIADFYTEIWHQQDGGSVDHYYQVRDNFNKTKDPKLFLFLLARCVKGSVRYNNQGGFNQSPDKRRKGTNPNKMRQNIEGVSRLLYGKCMFTSIDYRKVLSELKSTDFVYLDPPYQGVCGNKDSRYYSGICFDTLVLELEELNRKGIRFAVSYDGKRGSKTFGNHLPRYLGLNKIEIEAGRSTQATLLGRKEITVESLYLSPNLLRDSSSELEVYIGNRYKQLTLL
jgi:DNA adenine methylase